MKNNPKIYYYLALVLGIIFHGSVLFFTFEKTYDAYVHIFFAEHYASNWFDSWNFKWYAGFTITSYPPLVHQIVALLSKLVGLKIAFYLWSLGAVFLLIRGIYKFSLLWVDHQAAGIAAVAAVLCSSIVEALHIFGQVPSLTGIAFLLNACPEIYKWFRFKTKIHFFLSLSLLGVTTTAHHVSTIFGMVFFVLPTIGLAVMDKAIIDNDGLERKQLFLNFKKQVFKILPSAVFFGICVIFLTIITIFPYWYWSKTDPITQVSIPHGSRENFLMEPNLGLIFFIIPWGILLFILPFIFQQIFRRRSIFLGFSFALAFLLGTGGTTPIPKMILGTTAFEILTLDRFTFWATIMSIPFLGLFLKSMFFGDLKAYLINTFGKTIFNLFNGCFLVAIVLLNVLIVNMGYFKAFQPEKIDIDPIVNFLDTDQHSKWRYLTLGFGDQMAWLAANTEALTVDGNYHSVRRLPEMTTRAVERLENAKYQKMDGIGALQDFLTTPEKYNLKYIFSNDKFYEPLLHFRGWSRIQRLENDIVVWEFPDVDPLPDILPSKRIPRIQRLMWGIMPLSLFMLTLILYLASRLIFREKDDHILLHSREFPQLNKLNWAPHLFWFLAVILLSVYGLYNVIRQKQFQDNPEQLILNYFDALDFKRFGEIYEYIDPTNKPSINQFDLERSVEDGILSSFAKLSQIQTAIEYLDDNHAKATVHAEWITALDKYSTQHEIDLISINSRWYLEYDPYEKYIPINQFYSLPSLSFKNQGRRRAVTQNTDREDILDRPEIHVLQSSLIKKDKKYAVVGELQNIDSYPAIVNVKAVVYDSLGIEICSYNAADIITHDLLPKEVTSFRVDFNYAQFDKQSPHSVVVFVNSVISDKEMYKYFGLNYANTDFEKNTVLVDFHNYGTKEINVPQIMYSIYDKDGTIVWVDHTYNSKGIRPQRTKTIKLRLEDPETLKVVQLKGDIKYFSNGISNNEMSIHKMASHREPWDEKLLLSKNYDIRFQANGFIYSLNQ